MLPWPRGMHSRPSLTRGRLNCRTFVCLIAGFCLAVVVGCSSSPGDSDCASEAECALGFTCIDGRCEIRTATDSRGPDRETDSGQGPGGFRNDAGPVRYDAGRAPYDAGSPGTDAGQDASAGADGGTVGSGCGPAACSAQGAECGQVIDQCGATIDCPDTCGPGRACGTGGFANRCQCQPQSCDELGAQCGTITDNCGVSRDCSSETGGCRGQDQCNQNRCECQPRSCSGVECGDIDTGCGYRRTCPNTCSAPERCGGGGQANQCGCTMRVTDSTYQVFGTARQVNAVDGSADWEQLSRAAQDDTGGADFRVRGSCSGNSRDGYRCTTGRATTEYLQLTNSPVAIPRGARVVGIRVRVAAKKRDTGTASFDQIALVGPRVSDSRARAVDFAEERYRNHYFGDSRDLWGRTWTAEEINATNFGIRIQMSASASCSSLSGTCSEAKTDIDHAAVRVFYEICD